VAPCRTAQRGLGALSQLVVGLVGSRRDRRVGVSDPLDPRDPRDEVEARACCRVDECRRVHLHQLLLQLRKLAGGLVRVPQHFNNRPHGFELVIRMGHSHRLVHPRSMPPLDGDAPGRTGVDQAAVLLRGI